MDILGSKEYLFGISVPKGIISEKKQCHKLL